MAVINVYEQYFEAKLEYNGVARKAALVMLTAESSEGMIRYEAAVTFFPYRDPEDFAVSYDAFFSKELFSAKGRRSKKREQKLLSEFREVIDALAQKEDGAVFWEKPLREARYG